MRTKGELSQGQSGVGTVLHGCPAAKDSPVGWTGSLPPAGMGRTEGQQTHCR